MFNPQQRALQITEKRKHEGGGITVEEMSNQFYRMKQEAEAGGSTEAQQITSALDWAFTTYADAAHCSDDEGEWRSFLKINPSL